MRPSSLRRLEVPGSFPKSSARWAAGSGARWASGKVVVVKPVRGSYRRRRASRRGGAALLRVAVLATAIVAVVGVAQPPPEPPDPMGVGEGERLLVIAPHPDDETLGAGGLIQRVIAHHGAVHVVLV